MPRRLMQLYALFYLFTISGRLLAQTIVIDPDNLPTETVNSVISDETFFVNGVASYGLTEKIAKAHSGIESIRKTLLSAITLKLVAEDRIKLHESISFTLPDLLERNPFNVAVTPHHILTETAGFAVPTILSNAPLKRYASHVRTAGQMTHDDIVGWAILIQFLEAKSGQPIHSLIEETVLNPLGLTRNDFNISASGTPLIRLSTMTGSGALIAEMARLTIRNRAVNGTPFLPKRLYDLMVRQQSWRMHPLTPNHTYGGLLYRQSNREWLSPPPAKDQNSPTFMAFPNLGIAFVCLSGDKPAFKQAVLKIAQDHFLPSRADNRFREASLLVPYERFSGYYVRADQPTAWLKDRLDGIQHEQLHISENIDGDLHLRIRKGGMDTLQQYEKQAPFHYRNANGSTLTLSPYKSGGYLLLDGVLYRYVGILGTKPLVIGLFPFVVIILFSSGLYASSKTSRAWQKMGQFGFIGTLMVCTGLISDYLWWPSALFEWNTPILVYAWRTLMNLGLMLVLSLPLFALSFVRKNSMPEGPSLLYVPFHLALISIAAATLFLILVAWGVAAEFSAY